jgi:hypothetical protein
MEEHGVRVCKNRGLRKISGLLTDENRTNKDVGRVDGGN